MINKIIIGIVALSLVLSVIAISKDSGIVRETIREVAVGASAGTDHYNRESFRSGLTQGGRIATTTTAATYTVARSDFNGTPVYFDVLPNVNTTISLNATSTHEYIPNVGDVAKIYWRNASSTAGATITLAAEDIGVDLQKNEDTADLAINGLDWAELTLIRESANLVTIIMSEFIEGD